MLTGTLGIVLVVRAILVLFGVGVVAGVMYYGKTLLPDELSDKVE